MGASTLIRRVAQERTQLAGGFSNPETAWEMCLHKRYPASIAWEECVAKQAQLRTNSLR
jgi:hypothetical protein